MPRISQQEARMRKMAAHEAPITRWVREKEGQAAAALNCDAVVPACCSACLAAVVAALAYWQHGHDPCRLPHHSRPPTASIGAEDRQEGLGPGYPQPGAGRHAAMCIS